MQDITTYNGQSPFDEIKQTSIDGSEFWSARDLQPLMGYPRWNEFQTPIKRAKQAAANQDMDVNNLFRGSAEKSGGRPREDFELARAACYLVAMNGDPNMPEVAAAQAYFAVLVETETEWIPVSKANARRRNKSRMARLEKLDAEAIRITEEMEAA